MKWIIRLLILFFIVYGAVALYENGNETAMAGILFFIALPYAGFLIAMFLQNDTDVTEKKKKRPYKSTSKQSVAYIDPCENENEGDYSEHGYEYGE